MESTRFVARTATIAAYLVAAFVRFTVGWLLLEGAVGWILADTVQRVDVGDHVIFVGAVRSLEPGPGEGALVYLDRRYVEL